MQAGYIDVPCVCAGGSVIIAKGSHPFPSRTRSLSPSAPTILEAQASGKIGHRRSPCTYAFLFPFHSSYPALPPVIASPVGLLPLDNARQTAIMHPVGPLI